MIVDTGKSIIVNFFAGQAANFGDTIALGTGNTPVTSADTSLSSEIVLLPVTAIAADTTNKRVVFKAIVQPGLISTIYEAGVYYNGSSDSRLLVARTVLASALTTDPDLPTEIEYSLEISV